MKKFLLLVAAIVACAMGMAAQETLTVHDGEATSSFVPIYGYWCDNFQKCEFVMPAEELQAMKGKDIMQLTWYLNTAPTGTGWGNANFQIFMKEIEETTLSAFTGLEGALVVYEGPIDVVGKTELNIEFVNPYGYNGGNLLIGVYNTAKGSYMGTAFIGKAVENACVQGYSGSSLDEVSANAHAFLPKTTFTYDEKPAYAASVAPESLDFGRLNPGMTKDLTIKVRNNGANAFTPALTVSAPFSVTYEASELASGKEVEIPVTFAPTALGAYSLILTVDCGDAGTKIVDLFGVCTSDRELTVCDDISETVYLPIYGFYYDTPNTLSQMIYPANMLEDVKGGNIIGVKFYLTGSMELEGGNLEFSLAETENTGYTNGDEGIEGIVTDLTTVANTPMTPGVKTLDFVFDTPYPYNGGNLALQTLVVEGGNWKTQYFKGTNVDYYAGYCEYSYAWSTTPNVNLVKFLPKMTIIYTKDQEEPVEPVYYVVGGFNGWSQVDGMQEITEAGATITVSTQDLENPNDESQEFKIITADQNGGWIWYGGQDDNQAGYFGITDELLGANITLDDAGANFRLPEAGTYNIKLVPSRNVLDGLKMVVSAATTGIETIKGEVKGDNNYYNLMGQKMNGNKLPAGIYIHNGKKVIVR